ncbi:MAG TPA: acetate--CoA ligase family protein [Acetobacteraceae bacterium]|jgi:acyl-CoA synthetase (NDP forming)|nr:acetate--CoA ligase family protein [Acetobacteraceae bacterium]
MSNVMDALIKPQTIAVIGASSRRSNNGNVVLTNLRDAGFNGQVIPVHAEAAQLEGYDTVRSIDELAAGTDVAVVSVPASGVPDAIRRLDRAGVRSAIVMSNGFTVAEEAELRQIATQGRIVMHGPNCMGLVNVSDALSLYTAKVSPRVQRGSVALLAQSGSAAIAVMNSANVGFSKVVTLGSEFRVTSADYLRWLAHDDETRVIGVVMESIQDPDAFADAVDLAQAAGKSVAVLKVGQSQAGALATQAHTGALIRDRDAVECFFVRYGVPTVSDYDELVAALECMSVCRWRPTGMRLGVIGISGGEVALICDLAEAAQVPLASFTVETADQLKQLLPGSSGLNPLDLGATVVSGGNRNDMPGMKAVLDDPNVDMLFVIQDAQYSIAARSIGRYKGQCQSVVELSRESSKPIVVASSTGEALNDELSGVLAGTGIPMLRGLRVALAATRCMATWSARRPDSRRISPRRLDADTVRLRHDLGASHGPVRDELVRRLLDNYALPRVRSGVARDAAEAATLAETLGYPLVVKVASRDVPHRSDVGGVQLGISDVADLRAAITRIEANVRANVPGAVIDGFELQEELVDCVEAMVGFKATPPFGALVVVGMGGTLVELQADRALGLSPVFTAEAAGMIDRTRLGALLHGYRNLIPRTDTAELVNLVCKLSNLAADFCDVLVECDLNPVLIRKGSGEVRVVDALFVASR